MVGIDVGSGNSLAVAYSNKTLCLINVHTGKTVHSVDCAGYSESQVCCLGWGVNFTNKDMVHLNLEDVVNQDPESRALDLPPDLPKDLAYLDIEGVLPKLSPLSSSGIE